MASKRMNGTGPTGRPLPNPPTAPDVLDKVAQNMAIEAAKRLRAKKAPKAAARAPKATVAKDANGKPVEKPTKAQAAAATNKARLQQEADAALARNAATAHFGGKARDKKLGGAQADIEDPQHAGVHPDQKKYETEVGGIAVDRLRQYVERYERLTQEQKALGHDKADIMAEAKAAGFHPKAIRAVLARRAMPAEKREEEETLVDLYSHALGL